MAIESASIVSIPASFSLEISAFAIPFCVSCSISYIWCRNCVYSAVTGYASAVFATAFAVFATRVLVFVLTVCSSSDGADEDKLELDSVADDSSESCVICLWGGAHRRRSCRKINDFAPNVGRPDRNAAAKVSDGGANGNFHDTRPLVRGP